MNAGELRPQPIEPFAGLRGDLLRTSYACHVAETTRRFVREGEGSVSLFRLLRDTLAALAEEGDPALAARYFELRLLDLLGYRPELAACPGCGVELGPEGNAFGVDAGGVLCPRCAPADPHAIALTGAAFNPLFDDSLANELAEAEPGVVYVTQAKHWPALERSINALGYQAVLLGEPYRTRIFFTIAAR